jgi:hypothetical protein
LNYFADAICYLVIMYTKMKLRVLNSAFVFRKNLFFVEHMHVSMPQIN